ncbi:coiled-coil domain-containing protein [Clostridium perfringens]|uniref:coiled-coil domain-containing protein n=1 Tax=Clostridium perfringens TaxID=1502 RepID=UPI00399D0905
MKFKNEKLNKKFKEFKGKKEKLEAKIKYKKTYKYYFFCFFFIFGYTIFFSSGYIFNTQNSAKSTPIGVENKMNNSIVKLTSEKYNPNIGLLQVNLNVEKTKILFENNIELSAIEKKDVNKELPLKTIRLNENQYVALIKVPDKWANVAIQVKEKDIEKSSSIKIFIDKKLCVKDDNLKELSKKDYLIENVDIEITDVEKEINEYKNEIEKNNKIISKTEQEIRSLEGNKKYEIEEDVNKTNQKVESLKSEVKSLNENNEELKKKINTANEKINKLNLKKEDYKKMDG